MLKIVLFVFIILLIFLGYIRLGNILLFIKLVYWNKFYLVLINVYKFLNI